MQGVTNTLLVQRVAAGEFGVTANGCQRGAEFVGGVGDEPPNAGLGLLSRGERARDWPSSWFNAAPT